ncbi:hypothetical protein P170DRAFT_507995 [Aspergillus steynii IBT 23096]|uniref:Zn(2)-C6 fungal-type domain-containing protein n=1 Tax=Aspergillus steynii IBT 23096 TaxID=1392250 RepID=A0A2I2GKG4_9EURO|nr:uncharacterized protein P170DRAFT_507995 [Aspergillus steynii IBT 23096]PLB53347.1 hypothetical protein P170DRAFT_507995 [Aspergillus steynii IBT 23096]
MGSGKTVHQGDRPRKPVYSRAFSHKVRTGCLTCRMRHKKCDERRPTCHRCQADKVVCDGYPHVPAQSTPYSVPSTYIGASLDDPIYRSASEAQFFHHFRTCTCAELAEAPGDRIFWTHFALPLAHSNDAVAKSIAAVGAVHRRFITRELEGTSPLDRAALRLYNDAISSITTNNSLTPESIMVCCLLFICYESMTGRYAESIRHLKAGLKLLATSDIRAGIYDSNFARELLNVFARVSVEVSVFMEDQPLPLGDSFNWAVFAYDQSRPFRDLAEAEQAMRKVDIDSMQDIKLLLTLEFTQTETRLPHHEESKNMALSALRSRLQHWNAQFDPLAKALSHSLLQAEDSTRLTHLRLHQNQLLIVLGVQLQDQPFVDKACATYLSSVEVIAQSIISRQRRTFSIDGVLVSGISLVVSASSCLDIQRHACLLLQSLNRREGLWDSREILELHQATLSQSDPRSWYTLPVSGGIPAYMKSLSLFSSIITPDNALLHADPNYAHDYFAQLGGGMIYTDDELGLRNDHALNSNLMSMIDSLS